MPSQSFKKMHFSHTLGLLPSWQECLEGGFLGMASCHAKLFTIASSNLTTCTPKASRSSKAHVTGPAPESAASRSLARSWPPPTTSLYVLFLLEPSRPLGGS